MTFQVFNAFINKGYDELEVIIETITEDVLSLEFSTKIPLLGQRKKVALAVREAKEKQRKSNNTAVGDKPKTFFVSRTKNLCPQQMLRARANGETFVSATMCPRLPGP